MKLKPSKLKLKMQPPEPCTIGKKKQRTKLPRRVRSQISPILFPSQKNSAPPQKKVKNRESLLVDSSSYEVSCDSSRVTVESSLRKRKPSEIDDVPFRRITRSYYKQMKELSKGNEAEASESSCCVESNSKEIQLNDTVSVTSALESCLTHNKTVEEIKTKEAVELSEISKTDTVSVDESVVWQKPKGLLAEANDDDDLACTEHISYDDVVSESYSCEFEFDVSDYTPSFSFDSGSEFSDKSVPDSPPSRMQTLLLEFRQQFSRSSAPTETTKASLLEPEYLQHSTFVRFGDEEDEESYQRLRERERRQLFLRNYVELYRSATDYGDLILRQRLLMVHWIVEQSTARELELETMFLGVGLLDRFLSKGFFKIERNLQIVGIACLTLATRIEENQPYNCVRQKNFYVGRNVYNRFEVVAMEWLVQEVLNFQCFLPTIYNFMWFYLKAAGADAEMEKRTRYLAVLALSDHEQLGHWPSAVAAALVILASVESEEIGAYERLIEVHIRTEENELHECIKSLEWLLQYVN